MPHSFATEAALDNALAQALFGNSEFASWFFNRTDFASRDAKCVYVRADNPWSKVTLSHPDHENGLLKETSLGRETDVLAIFETSEGRRLALHIENKLADSVFTPFQAESYKARLPQWRMRPKLGMYHEATSVLVAPQIFYDRHTKSARLFDTYVPHEAIAAWIPAFHGSPRRA